jgi:hypothetical protein
MIGRYCAISSIKVLIYTESVGGVRIEDLAIQIELI